MELSDFIKQIKNNWQTLVITAFFGTVLGVAAYYIIPQYYLASGSFYINRKIDTTNGQYFGYEGYYSQQTALSYTSTVMGLFESTDVKAQALKSLFIEVNDRSLRNIKRNLSVKKPAPQVIFVTFKSTSADYAQKMYQALADATITTAQKLNESGDRFLQIEQISKPPVIDDQFRNVFVNSQIGLGLGLVLGLVIISLRKKGRK